jgi:hypothetical protein
MAIIIYDNALINLNSQIIAILLKYLTSENAWPIFDRGCC